MAAKDWRRYYAPILSAKDGTHCRIWAGKLFTSRIAAQEKGAQINRAKTGNYRCIGIAGLRGKRHKTQQEIWSRSDGNRTR